MSASNDTATATTNQNKPNLPYTISVLDAPFNGKVYLVRFDLITFEIH